MKPEENLDVYRGMEKKKQDMSKYTLFLYIR